MIGIINRFLIHQNSYLCPEPYPEENLKFLEANNIKLYQFGIEGKTVRFASFLLLVVKEMQLSLMSYIGSFTICRILQLLCQKIQFWMLSKF